MKMMMYASDMILPLMFVGIILFGWSKGIKVYDVFVEGAKGGLKTVLGIMPTLIGLMVAVGIIRASGALDLLVKLVQPVTSGLGFPAEALPLTFMRLVSSSAATGLLLDIYKSYGPDSFVGRFVSVMMSCTETVFYTMSVYFMSVKITKTRYTMSGALVANVAGIVASVWIVSIFFGR